MSEPRGYITEDDIAEGAGFKRPEPRVIATCADRCSECGLYDLWLRLLPLRPGMRGARWARL